MKTWILAAIGWAALTSAAGHAQPAAAWLAIGTIGLAPLALAILCEAAPARPGSIRAVDAEALVWTRPDPEAPRATPGAGLRGAVRWPAQPLSV
jgi:hypothetical protein